MIIRCLSKTGSFDEVLHYIDELPILDVGQGDVVDFNIVF